MIFQIHFTQGSTCLNFLFLVASWTSSCFEHWQADFSYCVVEGQVFEGQTARTELDPKQAKLHKKADLRT